MSEYTDKIAKQVVDALWANGFGIDDEGQARELVSDVIHHRLCGGGGDVKYMPLEEFGRLGFLQEANRLFFHPHGLALEITCDGEGYDNAVITGIWDHRDDPEGMLFGEVDPEKVNRVARQRDFHYAVRGEMFQHRMLGATDVQPVDWVYPEEESRGDTGHE